MDDAIMHQGHLDPGIAFLQKPFTADDLNRRVREVLDDNAGRLDRRPWPRMTKRNDYL